MLAFSTILVSFLLASGSADAAPLSVRFGKRAAAGEQKMMGSAPKKSMGAAYFITNEPDGNFVVGADIEQNGQLKLRQAVSTGGKGGHANSTGPDPLFTQGAVKASAASKMLCAVNPGDNTISLFKINPQDPTSIKMVGQPTNSGGEFPVSVAFNKAGDMVCALNGGKKNGVQCFKADAQKGLTAMSNTQRDLKLDQTTPPNGPPGSVSHLVFSEDGKSLVASVKGFPPMNGQDAKPGMLAVWDVSQDGNLSQDFKSVAPPEGGALPFSMSVVPGKNAILATDAAVGFELFDFKDGGAKASGVDKAVKIDGQMATCWSSFSKKTGNLYLTDIGTSKITEVNVDDKLKGSIVKQYDQKMGTATIDNDIGSMKNNDFLYTLKANATTINVMSLNAPGKAQTIQDLEFSQPAKKAGLQISPDNVQGMTVFMASD